MSGRLSALLALALTLVAGAPGRPLPAPGPAGALLPLHHPPVRHPPGAAGPPPLCPHPPLPGPRPEARLSIPRLGITCAPVWTRSRPLPRGGLRRLAHSTRFGRAGPTVVDGEGVGKGAPLRWLGSLQPPQPSSRPHPFPGDEIQVWTQGHFFRYYTQRVMVMTPTDERLLRHTWRRPTLLLRTSVPNGRGTQRLVVVAQTVGKIRSPRHQPA